MYVPHTLSTYVSFSLEDASLPFEVVEQLVLERHDTLAELNLQVLGLSQGRLCHLHGDVSYDILLQQWSIPLAIRTVSVCSSKLLYIQNVKKFYIDCICLVSVF